MLSHQFLLKKTSRFLIRNFVSLVDKHFKNLSPAEISPKVDYNIAGRKHLPGSQGEGFPKHLKKPRTGFPYALQALPNKTTSLPEWAQLASQIIDENLTKYGTILLRGLPLELDENFSEFTKCLPYTPMNYPEGGTGDRGYHDKTAFLYNASYEPPEYTIELHNELAYLPVYPKKVVFYCLEEPKEGCGGLTVICDGKELMKRLSPDVIKKLEEAQVRYIHRLPDEKKSTFFSWQRCFQTESVEEAKKFLEKTGDGYEYNAESGVFSYWVTYPAFKVHPDTGERVWFNQSHYNSSAFKQSPMFPGEEGNIDTVYSWDTSYGDGSPIEPEVIQHIRACMWHSTYGFQWKTGDMLIIDNLDSLHGRLSYTGERKILSFLMKD